MNPSGPGGPPQAAGGGAQPEAEYCRFGKRNLDGLSWLYPLVNNPIGDLLNIELRHEHLFFIQGERIRDNIGYSEKGTRFREEDYGKHLNTLADLQPNGYWLEGRRYDPPCMREALDQIDDGAYYSLLSNQCQDWTDRLKREALRVERERGVRPAQPDSLKADVLERVPAEAAGTAPAAWYLGSITFLAGALGLLAPMVTAALYLRFLGLLLAAMGISDIHYATRAGPRCAVPATILSGLVKIVFGTALLLAHLASLGWAWALPGVALLVLGLLKLVNALFSRPHSAWLGSGGAGIVEVAAGALILHAGRNADARLVGLLLALSLVGAGVSTLVLDWRLRKIARKTAAAAA